MAKKNKKAVLKNKKPAKKPVKIVKKIVKKKIEKKVDKKLLAKKSKPIKKTVKITTKKVAKPAKKIEKKPAAKKLDKNALKKLKLAKAKEIKAAKALAKKQKDALKKEKALLKKQKQQEKIAKAKELKLEKQRQKEEKLAKSKAIKEVKEPVKIVPKEERKINRNFKIGEYIVYPSHGIGKVLEIENTKVLGQDFSCYLLYFEKEKLTIKIPVQNAAKVNLRPLVSKAQMEEVLSILRSGVKKLKGMWSRRAQEYEAKINSGDIFMLAEVLRDLTRDVDDGERSYSERIIYETAVARLAAEYATIYNVSFEEARDRVVVTAKDKLGSSDKSSSKDDGFDYDVKKARGEDEEDADEEEIEEEDEDEDEEYEDEDDDFDDDDDDAPKKKRRK